MYKVLDLLEGQGRTDSASSWGLHTFNVIRLVSKEYVYVVHNASLNTLSSDEEMTPLAIMDQFIDNEQRPPRAHQQ